MQLLSNIGGTWVPVAVFFVLPSLTEIRCVALDHLAWCHRLRDAYCPGFQFGLIRSRLALRKRRGVLVVRYCSGEVTLSL